MLALSRKEGEKIVLIVNRGTSEELMIEVSVVMISRNNVKLGFEAAPNVSIVRKEIYEGEENGKTH